MLNTSISIDKLIPVKDTVLNFAAKYMRLIGLYLTDNTQIPTSQRVLTFTSLKSVGEFFGYDSKEYFASINYFAGYDGSLTTPSSLNFARYVSETTKPEILGGLVLAKLATIKAIVGSTFDIKLNGTTYSTGVLDLSTATSYSDVGNKIITALKTNNEDIATLAIVMTFNSNKNNYVLTINDTAETWEFDYCATTDLSLALSMTKATGAYLSNSIATQTPAQNMDAIVSFDKNWVSFAKLITLTDADQLALCNWAAERGTNYTYVLFTTDTTVLDINNNDNIIGQVNELNIKNIIKVFGGIELAAFTMGVGACINYTQVNGVLTWAFKSQTGLAYTCNSDQEYDVLTAKGVNFYGNFSSKSDTYLFYQAGKISGDYVFIDNFYNQVWLSDALQNKAAVLFKNTRKIGNGDVGYQQIRSTIGLVMSYALINGVCQTNVEVSEEEAKALENILGFDISGDIYNNGFYLQIGNPTTENKVNRVAPDSNLFYTNNGAIQKLPINTYFII